MNSELTVEDDGNETNDIVFKLYLFFEYSAIRLSIYVMK